MNAPRNLAERMAGKSERELLAMFATPEDWTTEALDAAQVELRRRGLKPPGGPAPSDCSPASEVADDRPDVFVFFGTYPNAEARLLLDAFVAEAVEFTLDAETMGVASIPGFQAANGGTFGRGVGIAIGVHAGDCERAMEIRNRVFRITR